MTNSEERLQKIIAKSGITSRRKAEQLITEGKVKVNGRTVITLGTKVTPNDKVEVNGVPLEKEPAAYYMLYKPRGVISSVSDDKDRKVVTDFLPGITERIFPIGRLDYDTSGILLLTNDGDFANLLMHPKYEVEKVYTVKTKGIPEKVDLTKLLHGVKTAEDTLKAIRYDVRLRDKKSGTMMLDLTLKEGKNRHIRRMMEALGYPVLKLKREKYGLLTLGDLRPGEYRRLTPHEVKQMRNLAKNIVKE
jgi:23S rRNA pseudouridine2605 synthase